MYVTIAAIETAGPDGRARRLVFSQGEPRLTAAAVVRVLGLDVGDEAERRDLESRIEETEPVCAKERALRVLGYRERSTRELEKRLVDDGYPEGVARELVCRLAELGLVDDERFAYLWARTRAGAGFGSTRVSRELRDRGIPPVIIDAALMEAFEGESEIERARSLLGSRVPGNRKDRERLVQKLLRRGFSLSVALKAVPEVGEHDDGEA